MRHSRAHVRYHWRRVGLKRRRLYYAIWPASREYLDTISLNEHARVSLGKRCSCEFCQNHYDRDNRGEHRRQAINDAGT